MMWWCCCCCCDPIAKSYYVYLCLLLVFVLQKDKIIAQFRKEFEQKVQELEDYYNNNTNNNNNNDNKQKQQRPSGMESSMFETSGANNSNINSNNDDQHSRELIEQLQEAVTRLQSDNLKLRKKLKESGVDLMEGVQKSNASVAWSSVSTREYLPQQGQGVPSGGELMCRLFVGVLYRVTRRFFPFVCILTHVPLFLFSCFSTGAAPLGMVCLFSSSAFCRTSLHLFSGHDAYSREIRNFINI